MDQLNLNLLLDREDNEKKLIECLNNFEENKKNVLTKRGMYIYGSPGTGKTVFVEKILKKLNYDIIKYDAGDVRNKTIVDQITKHNMSDKNVLSLMQKKTKKIAIMMDELDGMNSGDKGGINTLTNMISIVLIQFIAIPGTLFTSKIAEKYSAMFSLKICLIGWAIIILLAIGFIPIKPKLDKDFDYLINDEQNGKYKIIRLLELTDSFEDKNWSNLSLVSDASRNYSDLNLNDKLDNNELINFKSNIKNNSSYSLRIINNDITDDYIGINHLSNKTDGPLGWWPTTLRKYIWEPIGINVNMQWIILGAFVGIFLGGSQALARSIFSVMTPVTRSAEFFSFFGFIGRVSSVFGPLLFTLTTGFFDQRLGVFTILILIFSGYILLFKIDVEKGKTTAIEEDKSN